MIDALSRMESLRISSGRPMGVPTTKHQIAELRCPIRLQRGRRLTRRERFDFPPHLCRPGRTERDRKRIGGRGQGACTYR